MAKRAVDGITELIQRTGGSNRITAKVVVDQPYAQDQHETMFYKHPRGGKAKYLETPLFAGYPEWLQKFANGLLKSKESLPKDWAEVGRSLKREVPRNAPVEFGDLRQSAGLVVTEGSSTVVDEPPAQGRLTEGELDAKDHMRHAGLGYRE